MDYYSILSGLNRNCSADDMFTSYHKAALKWHPLKNPSDVKTATDKFREISEAYYVLSTPSLRAIFDQWGEKGLKEGVHTVNGGFTGKWVFDKDPEEMFVDFFGTTNPFDGKNAGLSTKTADIGLEQVEKMPPISQNVYLSLEEFYSGCVKKTKIVRQRLTADGNSTSREDKIMTFTVKPGWRNDTKVQFKGQGNEGRGYRPGDVQFYLKEKPHPRFTRDKSNLIMNTTITLKEALCGTIINIKTLDKRIIPFVVNQTVQTGTELIVPNEGMPNIKDPKTYGNMIIKFIVVFPDVLSKEQKDALNRVL